MLPSYPGKRHRPCQCQFLQCHVLLRIVECRGACSSLKPVSRVRRRSCCHGFETASKRCAMGRAELQNTISRWRGRSGCITSTAEFASGRADRGHGEEVSAKDVQKPGDAGTPHGEALFYISSLCASSPAKLESI